ncbi:MAG: T9SS type A sorting domain-containing protein [Bacteroidia bacterium]|nr:T9SS type A sorting domain-containing protein [Bacteroidia bacterium]
MKKLLFIFLTISTLGVGQIYQTGTITLTFNDPARTGGFGSGAGPGRQIQTEVYYPSTISGSNVAVASGTFPVVVIGHGFVMDWNSYDNIYSMLSKRGYIVALPRTEGGFSPSHSEFGLDLALVANKITQLNVTNTVAPIFVGKVDSRVALSGHSMGGGSSFLGAKSNSSITCLFNFAAAQTNPTSSQAAKQVTVPTLIIGGQSDCVAPPATNQDKMWDSTASSKKYEIIIKSLTHCDFGNGTNFNCVFGQSSTGCSSTVSNATALQLYMNFVNPFLDFNLKGICTEGTRFMDSLNLSQVIFNKKQLGVLGCLATSVGSIQSQDILSAFPNPTDGIVYLKFPNEETWNVELFSALGLKLDSEILPYEEGVKINMEKFAKGIYFIKVSDKNQSYTKKILKY